MKIVALRSERPAFSFECGDDAFGVGGLGKWNVSNGTGDQDIEI